MTFEKARLWLVTSSLILLTGYGLILIAAPAFGFPLSYDEALQLLHMVFPLFLGYLSSAILFVFQAQEPDRNLAVSDLLRLLVKGPFYVSTLLSLLIFI